MAKQQQKTALEQIDAWHKTKHGYLLFGLGELLLAYGFFSWAIDNGHLWTYFIGIILLVGTMRNFVALSKEVIRA
jgi:hypothetical protein